MKRMLNLFAETLSLPFSDFLNSNDPFVECAEKSNLCNHILPEGTRIVNIEKRLDETAILLSGYLNQHVEIPNLTILQGLIHYVFSGSGMVSCSERYNYLESPRAVMLQYYLGQLQEIAESLITIRNGYAVLRPWNEFPRNGFFKSIEGAFQVANIGSGAFSPLKIELWNSIIRCIPEDLLISSYVVSRVREEKDSVLQRKMMMQILLSFGEHVQLADVLLDGVLNNGMAETHLHAGASRTFGVIWEDMMDNAINGRAILEDNGYSIPYKRENLSKQLRDTILEAAVIRGFLAGYLRNKKTSIVEFLNEGLLSPRYQHIFRICIHEIINQGYCHNSFSSLCEPYEPFWDGSYTAFSLSPSQLLDISETIIMTTPSLCEKAFLCYSLLHAQQFPRDFAFTALFVYYLRKKNYAYRLRVQDEKSKGLIYFQKYYDMSTDRGGTNRNVNIRNFFYTALQDPRIRKTEFRISPPIPDACDMERAVEQAKKIICEQLRSFIYEHIFVLIHNKIHNNRDLMLDCNEDNATVIFQKKWKIAVENIKERRRGELKKLIESYKLDVNKLQNHRFGIVYHLIKQGEKGEKGSCFVRSTLTEREGYGKYSFGDSRFAYEAIIRAVTNLRNNCVAVGKLIVGIDAASLEIPTEPWVFAPAFHVARHQNTTWGRTETENERKPLLGITYHVGEDFRHPISGLRHVDEAYTWLGMHAGDRIGHGLVLGINMERWFGLNGMFVIPRIEWLENNLWLWHLITSGQCEHDLSQYSQIIEKQIYEDARTIYGTMNGITIEALYQAYKSKVYPIEEMEKMAGLIKEDCFEPCDCFKNLKDIGLFPCWKDSREKKRGVWRENLLKLSYHCEFFKQRMKENIIVTTTPEQKKIAFLVQQYMRDKIAENGIIVEINPSSNTIIGEMDSVFTHPILKLREKDGKKVMVTINTDDPSVFNATVANEHAQIYYALRYNGSSAEDALKEVDTMRETALRTSFITGSESVSAILSDYEDVLAEI